MLVVIYTYLEKEEACCIRSKSRIERDLSFVSVAVLFNLAKTIKENSPFLCPPYIPVLHTSLPPHPCPFLSFGCRVTMACPVSLWARVGREEDAVLRMEPGKGERGLKTPRSLFLPWSAVRHPDRVQVRLERGESVRETRSQGMRTQCGRRRMRGHGVLTPPSGAASWTGPCPSADAGCASAPEGSRRGGTGRGGGGAPPCRGMDEEKRLDGRKRLPTVREGSLGDDGTGWNPKGISPPVSPAVVSTSVLLEEHGKGHRISCIRFMKHE